MLICWAVLGGFVLDAIFGDPAWLPHPVVLMGKAITALEKRLRAQFPQTPQGELCGGAVLAAVLPVGTFLITALVCRLAAALHPLAGLAVQMFWCAQALAARGLVQESRNVYKELQKQDLPAARKAVARIVGRDTQNLTAEGVTKAAVETVAENASDGVIAPLLYMLLGGAPLALTYKAVNTMDSMVGYKNARYLHFGRAAAKLDDCATAVDGISNQGAVSATVQEGDTYTIPAGYHNGSGTVSGVVGGGNYKLLSKTVAPTKAQQAITPDSGYYGLSDVTVSQIPDAYQDVSSVTAGTADTLTGKVLVTADGKVATGTMPNNGAVSKTLDAGAPSYTLPKGYHSGAGKVSVAVETKTVTPTKAAQDIVPSTGKVLTKVSVAAIPDAFADTSGADALAANILKGKTAFVNGAKVTGSMPDNGSATATMDGLTTTSVTIPAGYTAGGTVSLTADI